MKKVMIHENLQGEKLKELLSFVAKKSNKMSLARYYEGKLTQEEFNKMQTEYKALILEEDKRNRVNYNENINGYRELINDFYDTEIEVEEYFNNHLKQGLESYTSLKYEEFRNGKCERYNAKTQDLLYVKFTRDTPVTRGPVFEVCYFKLGEIFRKLVSNMNNLFEYPNYIENIEFEDLVFYNGERVALAICSHENFAYMDLEDERYEELLELSILEDMED